MVGGFRTSTSRTANSTPGQLRCVVEKAPNRDSDAGVVG